MNTPVAKQLKGVVGRAAEMAGVFRRKFRAKMVIVAFHRVNDARPEDGLTYSSAKFARFCRFFRDNFRVVPLSEQVAGCHAGADTGGTLSITLDDGYRDNFECAAPILRELGLPATFFVTTSFIGSPTVAPWDRELVPPPGWMSWAQVRALASQGFEIGCHTDTHIDLATADPQTIRAELEISRGKLAEALGKPVELFAYPFGGRENITEGSIALVREAGFSCCLACFGGSNPRNADPFHLNRIAVGQGFVTPEQFALDLLMERI